jgi:hypothetical protein
MKTTGEVLQIGSAVAPARTAFDLIGLREFFPRLHRRDPMLAHLGWALFLFACVFGALLFSNPVLIGGVNAWIKPIKFCISFGMYAWTVAWWFGYLRGNEKVLLCLRRSFFITIAVEILSIALQAVRDVLTQHHLTATLDSAIAATMTTMIFINTLLVIWVAVLFWRDHFNLTPAYVWSIRLGIVVFLVGNAIGGQMLAHHSHTIGAADGPSGMPFVNWSTIAGDLRISHFLSIHAIQVIPLIAFMLETFRPRWSQARQTVAVFVTTALFSIFVALAWVEAMLGIPLMRM